MRKCVYFLANISLHSFSDCDMTGGKDNQAVNETKPSSSKKRAERALRPKAKIGKKSADNDRTKIKNVTGTTELQGIKKNNKKKIVSERNEGDGDKLEEKKLMSIEVKKNGIAFKKGKSNSQQIVKAKQMHGTLQKEQKNSKMNENRRILVSEKRKSQMNKGKFAVSQKNLRKEKRKEKLDGLIFMCSAKTKPDCFRYGVMGVSMSKKEQVLGIKPGMKLFLYDFDLRLLYGVYKASSSGGVKLEPTAFNGAFPVQVRFTVHQDCYPLPESVFKRAIKENYNDRNKFDTELTAKQVERLIELFQPAELLPKAHAISPQPLVAVQIREPYANNHHKYEEFGRYSMLPHDNNLHLPKIEVPARETEFEQDTFLSEKEYRTYGLRRERPNPPASGHVAPVVEPYIRAHVTDNLLRHPPAVYRDIGAAPGEASHCQDDPPPHEREYQTYGISPRLELRQSFPPMTSTAGLRNDLYSNHYYSRHGSLAVDPYQPTARREDLLSRSYYLGANECRETYPVETNLLPRRESYLAETGSLSRRASYLTEFDSSRRRENEDEGRTYATSYASRLLFDYNQTRNYQEPRPEPSQAPVSSRYSFAGPSTLYR